MTYKSEDVYTPKDYNQRTVQKGFLRYHDPNNWPALRETLRVMGRADLIGNGKHQLVPDEESDKRAGRRPVKAKPGQKTGASHTSNRPSLQKNAENERNQRKASKSQGVGGNGARPTPQGSKGRAKGKSKATSRTR